MVAWIERFEHDLFVPEIHLFGHVFCTLDQAVGHLIQGLTRNQFTHHQDALTLRRLALSTAFDGCERSLLLSALSVIHPLSPALNGLAVSQVAPLLS